MRRMMWQGWGLIALAAWMAAAPWVLRVDDGGYRAVALAAGAVIGLLTVWPLLAPAAKAPSWGAVIAGAAAFFSPWAVGFASIAAAAWSTWATGIAVAGLGVSALPTDGHPLPGSTSAADEPAGAGDEDREALAG